jgi:hypothetical protein
MRMRRLCFALCAVLVSACGPLQRAQPTVPPRVGPTPTLVPSPTLGRPAPLPPTPTVSAESLNRNSVRATTTDDVQPENPAIVLPTPTPKPLRLAQLPSIADRTPVRFLPEAPRYVINEVISGTRPALLISIPGEVSYRLQAIGPPGADFPVYSIAPNGRFVAYYSGSAGKCCDLSQTLPAGGFVLTIASLLSGQNLSTISIVEQDALARFLDGNNDADAARKAYAAFLQSITAHSWSPDSTVLLLAAMRDGASSDVFAVDVLNNSARRITNTPGQLSSFHVSPDQRWVLTSDRNSIADDVPLQFQAIRSDGAQSRELGAAWGAFVGWFGPNIGALAQTRGRAQLVQLTAFDLDRGTLRPLWEGVFTGARGNPATGSLQFCGIGATGANEITALASDPRPVTGGACTP